MSPAIARKLLEKFLESKVGVGNREAPSVRAKLPVITRIFNCQITWGKIESNPPVAFSVSPGTGNQPAKSVMKHTLEDLVRGRRPSSVCKGWGGGDVWAGMINCFLMAVVMGAGSACGQVVMVPERMMGDFKKVAAENAALELVGYGDKADALAKIGRAEAYIGGPDEELLAAAGKLRWVHITSAGIEKFTGLEKLREGSIAVTNLKIYQGPEIADHAFALLLGLTRNMAAFFQAQEEGVWERREGMPMIELHGKKMLVIGYGGIGQLVAERARAFGMEVRAIDTNDIPLTRTLDGSGKPDELDEFLKDADVVVSCVPITKETEGMIGKEQFAAMKNGAYLINVSRGKVVDTGAMIEALRGGKLAGVGLDVVEPEPLPADSPLWGMKNVLITPHVAGVSDGRSGRATALIGENMVRFSEGRELKNLVSVESGY